MCPIRSESKAVRIRDGLIIIVRNYSYYRKYKAYIIKTTDGDKKKNNKINVRTKKKKKVNRLHAFECRFSVRDLRHQRFSRNTERISHIGNKKNK